MALISLRQLLDHAAENGYGVPAFNVNNMEQIQSIMEAADESKRRGGSPVTLDSVMEKARQAAEDEKKRAEENRKAEEEAAKRAEEEAKAPPKAPAAEAEPRDDLGAPDYYRAA